MRGLTTAASLWAMAAIGMAVGAGYLFGAAVTTALAMATLYALRSFRASVISTRCASTLPGSRSP